MTAGDVIGDESRQNDALCVLCTYNIKVELYYSGGSWVLVVGVRSQI